MPKQFYNAFLPQDFQTPPDETDEERRLRLQREGQPIDLGKMPTPPPIPQVSDSMTTAQPPPMVDKEVPEYYRQKHQAEQSRALGEFSIRMGPEDYQTFRRGYFSRNKWTLPSGGLKGRKPGDYDHELAAEQAYQEAYGMVGYITSRVSEPLKPAFPSVASLMGTPDQRVNTQMGLTAPGGAFRPTVGDIPGIGADVAAFLPMGIVVKGAGTVLKGVKITKESQAAAKVWDAMSAADHSAMVGDAKIAAKSWAEMTAKDLKVISQVELPVSPIGEGLGLPHTGAVPKPTMTPTEIDALGRATQVPEPGSVIEMPPGTQPKLLPEAQGTRTLPPVQDPFARAKEAMKAVDEALKQRPNDPILLQLKQGLAHSQEMITPPPPTRTPPKMLSGAEPPPQLGAGNKAEPLMLPEKVPTVLTPEEQAAWATGAMPSSMGGNVAGTGPFEPPVVTKPPTEMSWVIKNAQTKVERDAPGALTQLGERIPSINKVVSWLRPGLKMTGENKKVLVAAIAEGNASSYMATRTGATRQLILRQLEKVFGKKAVWVDDAKTGVRFIGTPVQGHNPITGTIKDIVENSQLYELNAGQKAAIAALDLRNTQELKFANEHFNTNIKQFRSAEGGAYLPNTAKDTPEWTDNPIRAVARGGSKERYYETARDRMEADATFRPVTNISKLLTGMDMSKTSAAAGETFRQVAGGMTRDEVIKILNPKLYARVSDLKRQLSNLDALEQRVLGRRSEVVDDFLHSNVEDTDLAHLRDALNYKRRGAQADVGPDVVPLTEQIKAERQAIMDTIDELRPALDNQPLTSYKRVEAGLYKYFPLEQATAIEEYRKVSNAPLLRFMENWRGEAFSGDTSPITGIQLPIGALIDPVGNAKMAVGSFKSAKESGNWMRSFSKVALAEDVNKDLQSWSRFSANVGHSLFTTPQDFAIGFLRYIPGASKLTESTYIPIIRVSKGMFDRTVTDLVKSGLPEQMAGVVSGDMVTKVYPIFQPERLGLPPQRSTMIRAIPSSFSFLTKPAELMGDAAKGLLKYGTGQKVTSSERLAVRLMVTMTGSVVATSVTSAAINAKIRGEDVGEAVIAALNPDPHNGLFMSVRIGDKHIPLGGTYRALIRAIYPREVKGIPFPVPFAGIPQYVSNRLNPAIGAQLDIFKDNRDFYGNKIMKNESFLMNVMQGAAYEVESALPLSLGTGMAGLRTESPWGDTGQQMLGQFAGTNYTKNNPIAPLRNKWAVSFEEYNTIPTDALEAGVTYGQDRTAFRRNNPEIDAKLFVTGQVGSVLTQSAASEVMALVHDNKLKPEDIKGIVIGLEVQKRKASLGVTTKNETPTEWLIRALGK